MADKRIPWSERIGQVQCCFTRHKTATSTFTQLLSSVLHRCSVLHSCLTSTETIRTIRDGEPKTATSAFTQLLSSVLQCGFTSVRLIRDGEPRTSTSTSTQLLGSKRTARVTVSYRPATEAATRRFRRIHQSPLLGVGGGWWVVGGMVLTLCKQLIMAGDSLMPVKVYIA